MLIRLTLLNLGLGLFVALVGAEVVRLSIEFKGFTSLIGT